MTVRHLCLFLISFLALPAFADDPVVISDEGISITEAEMSAALELIPDSVRSSAADDVGVRFV